MSDELKSLQEENQQGWIELHSEVKQLRELKATLVKALIVAENQLIESRDIFDQLQDSTCEDDSIMCHDQVSECNKALATVRAALQAAESKP